MLILGIESSCDETAAAVVEIGEDGRKKLILSNAVASQTDIHSLYGGVVPEIAGRAHSEAICPIVTEALSDAGVTMSDIDVIGVTVNPGLIGALLVGVSFAKALSYATGKPLVAVDHIKGHTAASYFQYPMLEPPFLSLVVSGGHTSIIDVRSYTEFVTIGRTRDDAAGEAFDKIGRVMGLKYPCGADMDRMALRGDASRYKLPCAAIADDSLDFSFSGLKTAALNIINSLSQKGEQVSAEDMAASFTAAFTSAVCRKLSLALDRTGYSTLVLAGGVSANSHLRRAVSGLCNERGVQLCLPSLDLCGDNGAMIASQAYYEYISGRISGLEQNAFAGESF